MTPQQFKQNREALNLTQQQLADKLGYNQASISRAENGTKNIKLIKAFELLILSRKK